MAAKPTAPTDSVDAVEPAQGLVAVLRPSGRLDLRHSDAAATLAPAQATRLQHAFACGPGHGLIALGADEVGSVLPPALANWRQLAARFIASVCGLPDIAERTAKPAVGPPSPAQLQAVADAAPPMKGAEYLSADVLAALWQAMDSAFDTELADARLPVQEFLKRRNPAWNLVGRVHFNLAENRKDEEAPFAFLATYTTRLSAAAKAQHLPLGKALQEFAGADNRERLLSLLTLVQRAAQSCDWLNSMVKAGEIYQPMRWSPAQAMQMLRDVPQLEGAGVVVRMPSSWRMSRPARPQVKSTVGAKAPSQLGLDAMLDFNLTVTLDGDTLTAAPAQAYNVTAKIAGRNPSLAPLVVMAPRSAWWQSASEQGNRLACWLEAMRALSAGKPNRDTFFVALSGHELGLLGIDAYIERRRDLVKRAHAWIFLGSDIGAPRQPNLIHASDDALEQWLIQSMAKEGLGVNAKVRHDSAARGEAGPIQRGGGRFVTVACGSDAFHNVADRWPESVDVALLARYARAFANGVVELAQQHS